ncbi:MAG TPA: hypothetical protein VHM91_10210 [Verrucomicrobiales bacterium]|nr:hypothetical protein [Verrucomicrobiales bacterium]
MNLRNLSLALLSGCLWTGRAGAVEFRSIASVVSDTAAMDYYPAAGLIEGPGVGFDTVAPFNRLSGTTWVTNDPNGYPSNYFVPPPVPSAKLVFDLGSDVLLAEISVWGYVTGIEGNSMKDFSLRFATGAEGPAGAGTSITFNPTYSAGPQISPRQSFLFGQAVTARYVELVPLSNNSALGPGGDRVGFGEVAFETIPVVAGSSVDLPADFALGTSSFVKSFNLPVRNLGASPLTLSAPVFTGAAAASFSVVDVPATLPPYSAGVIKLKFDPAGLAGGDVSATFKVNTNTVAAPVAQTIITAGIPAVPASRFYPVASVVSATDSTDFYKVAGLIEGPGVGFNQEQPHEQIIASAAASLWVTDAPNGAASYFAPPPAVTPLLTFDLGAEVLLSEISVWGYSSSNSNGMRDFTLSFATAAEGPAGAGTSITYQPTFTAQFGETVRDSFPFTGNVTARYVVLKPLNNWGTEGVAPGGDRVGIGEVAFQMPVPTTPPVDFRITAATRNAQGQFRITFGTQAGSLFTVYRSTDLNTWSALPNPITGAAGSADYTDTTALPAGAGKVFYRVLRTTVP